MPAYEGLLGVMRIGMAVVGNLIGMTLTGIRDQEFIRPIGDFDPVQVLKGKQDLHGTAKHAYVCSEWLDYFQDDCTDFSLEVYPRGMVSGTCVIVGRMVIKNYQILEMNTESNMAVVEGIGFDLYNVGMGASDVAQEIVHWVKDPDAFIGRYPAARLTDDKDILVSDGFQIEDSLVSLGHVYALVIPSATGNMRWSVNTNFGDPCSEDYDTHSDSIAANQTAVTIDRITCIDITAAFTGIALGDVAGLEFTREASHALDTVDDDCYYLGVLLTRA